jgi:acyl-CoA thioester hydrolase
MQSESKPAEFRLTTEVEVRFRDLDAFRHVNQAAYLTILEHGRLIYFRDVIGAAIPDDIEDWVLAESNCRYLVPVRFGDTVIVGVRAAWMRNSSFGAVFELRSKLLDRVAAEGTFVQVHVDRTTGRSKPLPDTIRQAIARYDGIAERQG